MKRYPSLLTFIFLWISNQSDGSRKQTKPLLKSKKVKNILKRLGKNKHFISNIFSKN